MVDNDEYIGSLEIRKNFIDEDLPTSGGHIYYEIRPTKSKKGYGTEILKEGIQICREIGLKDLIVYCNKENIPSRKIIENNKGILLKEISFPTRTRLKYKIAFK